MKNIKKILANKEKFITKAKEKFGEIYDFSLVDYSNTKTSVSIICPTHGIFKKSPNNLLGSKGCPRCVVDKTRIKLDEFIVRSKYFHGDKYDYSLVLFNTVNDKISIICPSHGIFSQVVMTHMLGQGCIKCRHLMSTDEFITKANIIHKNKYTYTLVKYIGANDKVDIICPTHGIFTQTPSGHLQGRGCSKCSSAFSKQEKEIVEFLKEFYKNDIVENDKSIINPYELDIFIPDKNIAIEYCGLFWHSESAGKNEKYHYEKYLRCKNKGIRLITIFEDEWVNKKNIVKSKLKSIFGFDDRETIYARNCIIKTISSKERKNFLNLYHIQGDNLCHINLGLFYENKLVVVMALKKHGDIIDLNRYATKNRVVGGFSKLLSYFKTNYDWESIETFADLRWSSIEHNMYQKNGFCFQHISKPNYWYFKNNSLQRLSRITYQKHKLKKLLTNYDESKSESENMKNNDFYKIFDCGNIKFLLKNIK